MSPVGKNGISFVLSWLVSCCYNAGENPPRHHDPLNFGAHHTIMVSLGDKTGAEVK